MVFALGARQSFDPCLTNHISACNSVKNEKYAVCGLQEFDGCWIPHVLQLHDLVLGVKEQC